MEWTDSECLRLVELFNDGLTDEQIGMKIGRTTEAVRNRRKKMGLRRVVTPASKPVYQPTNVYLDCMDWPFPLERPKTREISANLSRMGKSFLQWLFMSGDKEPAPDTIRVTYNKQRCERKKIKKRRRKNKQRRKTRRK